jgi:hypothetical protein
MARLFFYRAALPVWAVVLALLALSPLPMALPNGLAVAAIGLIGSAFLFCEAAQRMRSPAAKRSRR